MRTPPVGAVRLVPEPPALASLHAEEMPQKDQLCGAFWGALALAAAGHPADQDEVALRAGTTLATGDPAEWLPPGASPRTDYRLGIPVAEDEPSSGTSAAGVARAVEELSGGALAVVPVAGPWSAESVLSLLEIVSSLSAGEAPGCTLVANLRTGQLWGSRPGPAPLLDHLAGRPVEPPATDWDCGHFVGIAGSIAGSGGSLVVVRDTYRQLGWDGYHLQPAGALAAALARGDGKGGGVLCVCEAAQAGPLGGKLGEAGFELGLWDNGSADPGGQG
jgi:hypothetical protein